MGTQPCRDVRDAHVHTGFLDYKRTLDEQMRQFSLDPLCPLLLDWGSSVDHSDLYSWLHASQASWRRVTVVGFSLGAAMATIAAVEIAVRSGRNHCVALATFASPAVGDEAFVAVQNGRLSPHEGLRIHNQGDIVPMLGYSGLAVRPTSESFTGSKYHGGLEVVLWGKACHQVDPYHIHNCFTVVSTVNSSSRPQWVTFKFPGTTYKPSATHDHDRDTLGDHWCFAGGDEMDTKSGTKRMFDPASADLSLVKHATERMAVSMLSAAKSAARNLTH